jgi:hypothetical protein
MWSAATHDLMRMGHPAVRDIGWEGYDVESYKQRWR